ncbi:hypothetical protein BaRGS_00004264 [Batillaria attramentaria]|uniref:Uncharacterized protein n=1 Tax=Batillaria attramentaria TaxID=370345 RepID=A0ABD0LY87_9CAEN
MASDHLSYIDDLAQFNPIKSHTGCLQRKILFWPQSQFTDTHRMHAYLECTDLRRKTTCFPLQPLTMFIYGFASSDNRSFSLGPVATKALLNGSLRLQILSACLSRLLLMVLKIKPPHGVCTPADLGKKGSLF